MTINNHTINFEVQRKRRKTSKPKRVYETCKLDLLSEIESL